MNDILTPSTVKQLEDAWVTMSLINFLVKLMPQLKEHAAKIKINVSQDVEVS